MKLNDMNYICMAPSYCSEKVSTILNVIIKIYDTNKNSSLLSNYSSKRANLPW